MIKEPGRPGVAPLTHHGYSSMHQLNQLLALYKGAQTDAERRLLLETARICSPSEFPRLQEMILREEVTAVPLDRLAEIISGRRGISLQEGEQELRHLVFEHLRQRPDPHAAQLPSPAPPAGADAEDRTSTSSLNRNAQPGTTEVAILDGPSQLHAKPEGAQARDLARPAAPVSFGRLQPKGIGG